MFYTEKSIMRARAIKKSGNIPGLLPLARKTEDINLLEKIKAEFSRRRETRLNNLAGIKRWDVGYFTNKKYAAQNLKNIDIVNKIIARRIKEKNIWAMEDVISVNQRDAMLCIQD